MSEHQAMVVKENLNSKLELHRDWINLIDSNFFISIRKFAFYCLETISLLHIFRNNKRDHYEWKRQKTKTISKERLIPVLKVHFEII